MSRHASEVTDAQWSKTEPLILKRRPLKKGGRKQVEDRRCLEGILRVLRSGARWKDLLVQYSSPAACCRRLQEWEEAGVLLDLWRKFLGELDEEGILSWVETFSDGAFSPAKKGRRHRQNQSRKGYKFMVVADGRGVPLGVRIAPASPAEVTLIEWALEQVAKRDPAVAARGRTRDGSSTTRRPTATPCGSGSRSTGSS